VRKDRVRLVAVWMRGYGVARGTCRQSVGPFVYGQLL